MKKILIFIGVISVSILSSCKSLFKVSPYQTYVESLKSTGLNVTDMGKKWINAGERVLQNPNSTLVFPFREEIFFRQETPAAVAYKIAYQKSQKVKINVSTSGGDGVFLDFFEGLASKTNLISQYLQDTVYFYESDRDQVLLLRLQPHLLVNQHVIVEIVEMPKLGFPVKNGTNKDIKSFWGVDREGGSRKHEGVDIFNKRGTPILAVEDGVINRVQVTNLGGKVVWQRLGFTGPSIYYAHLDSQAVTEGQKIKKGEILGTMGNTGNAISTAPHLHFGIYTGGGAIDPKDYIYITDTIPSKVKSERKLLGKEVMVTAETEVLPVTLLAVSTSGITHQQQDGKISYVDKLDINNKKLRLVANINADYLLDAPENEAIPIEKFNAKESYSVLAKFNNFIYIEQKDKKGWVLAKP